MGRVKALRAEAKELYKQAVGITNGDERLVFVLKAIELETEADALEREGVKCVPQQQQQPQPDDDKE